MNDFVEALIIIIFLAMIFLPGTLIQRAFKKNQPISWLIAAGGLIIQIWMGLLLGFLASGPWIFGLGALFISIIVGVITIFFSIWMTITLPGKRKWSALGFILVTAVIVLLGMNIGLYFSPETTVARNAKTIAQAIEDYHVKTGNYPAAIDELIPEYLPMMLEAETTDGHGWLYQSTSDSYTFGYWIGPHDYGVTLCLYGSGWEDEVCRDTGREENDWEPFEPVITPGVYIDL
jgi:hypothetical protein